MERIYALVFAMIFFPLAIFFVRRSAIKARRLRQEETSQTATDDPALKLPLTRVALLKVSSSVTAADVRTLAKKLLARAWDPGVKEEYRSLILNQVERALAELKDNIHPHLAMKALKHAEELVSDALRDPVHPTPPIRQRN